jgi:F420-dependent oxidoreductase-like protein
MDFRIFIEPQLGASYDDQLRIARATEELGFDAFFRSDHFMASPGSDGLPGPTDSWTTLAGLARETTRIRLGTLVSSATFRFPGVLAIQVAQVDQMSGGRVELGLGAGWFAREHEAYGIPFPGKRFGILEEQLAIITGLWSTPIGSFFSFDGEHYSLIDSPALPKPVQSTVPVIVGGTGPSKTPALAARFAAEYNAAFAPLEDLPAAVRRVRDACESVGRDPGSMTYSLARTTAVGASESEAASRAAASGNDLATLKQTGLAGTTTEAVDRIGQLAELGFDRLYLQILDIHDLDHLDFLAREVIPRTR